MSDQTEEATFKASGAYEYSYHQGKPAQLLQIFSQAEMRSTWYDAQEALDLLRFLQSRHTEIEVAARQQAEIAQQLKRQKTREERIDDLFR
ncbi:MAG: hypothetical protein M3Y81_28520 [Chloroflexota bacterium]|nr:hypothetical protein [Chloroflexota bacterium]